MLIRLLTGFFLVSLTISLLGQRVPGLRNLPIRQANDDDRPAQSDTTKRKRNSKGSIFLNDSSRSIYGPKTTLTISEEDIFFNRIKYKPIDTSITNLHRWVYPKRLDYLYHDLGQMGTALNPIFPQVRNFAGAVSGFDAYTPYHQTEYPTYYDTKSPYVRMNLVWGGIGRAQTRIEYSRNITPRWNFGFDYRPILVDKQLLRSRKGDRQVIAHYYDFYSSFKSKSEKVLALFNFRRTRHRVFENGGVYLSETESYSDYFDKQAEPRLVAAETAQFFRSFHLFGQYAPTKAFQLYTTLDLTRESNHFTDNFKRETSPDKTLFDNWEPVKKDTLQASDNFALSTFQSEMGVKGRAAFLFYNVFYKLRTYSANYKYDTLNLDQTGSEHYLGGRLAFDVDSLTRLQGKFEINQLGNYSLEAQFSSKWLDARFTQSIARPSFLSQGYWGSHDFWKNDFHNTTGLKLDGFLKTPFKKFLVAPGLAYTLLSQYIYFRKGDFNQTQTVLPVQASGDLNVVNPQVKLGLTLFKTLKINTHIIHSITLSDADGAFPLPDWWAISQIAYDGYIFKKNLQIHAGIDVFYRSGYFANAYDYAIQQYYVQTETALKDAVVADVFINGRMKRSRFFFKYNNLAQLIRGEGYLATPGYPGTRNVIDLGFEFIFFD